MDQKGKKEKKKSGYRLDRDLRMEALSTLAGGIAHDFNNVLTSIIGYTEMALAEAPKETQIPRYLIQVLKASHVAKELVNKIFTFTCQHEQKKIQLKMGALVKDALMALRPSLPKNVEIRFDIAPDAGNVLADPAQINQVLINLCNNAAEAIGDVNGILEVNVINAELGSEYATIYTGLKSGSYVRMMVGDTGHGMNWDTMERIFDPYFTTKDTTIGAGMGLSVVHGIVQSHGGAIIVYSEPENGTAVNVFFPRIKAEEIIDFGRIKPLVTGNESVLLIDDETLIAELGQQMLRRLGYKIVTHTNPVEALEIFRKNKDKFDIIITDMSMPYMSGDKLSQELRSIRPDIPIILCSGFSEKILAEKISFSGIEYFLMKPYSAEDISKAIRKALDKMH